MPSSRRRLDPSWALDLAMAGLCAVVLVGVLERAFAPQVATAPELQPAIGAVEGSRNDVRRRPEGQLLWRDVDPGQAIHDADAVYAAADSDAVIRLDDGTTFTLDERSLVVLRRRAAPEGEHPALALELIRGGARGISTPGTLTVTAQGAHISTQAGTTLRVRSGESGPSVEVARGKATVTAQGGQQASLSANERLALEHGALQWMALRVGLEEPADAQVHPFSSDSPRVTFRWIPPSPGARCRWQLATSTSFRPVAVEGVSSRGQVEIPVPGEGLYHWRVLCDGQESEQRSIRFWEQRAPVLIAPAPEEVVDLSGGAPLWASWSRLPQGGDYLLELAREGDFRHPALSVRASRTSVKLGFTLEEGRYCLRVRGGGALQAPWSQPACFRAVTRPLLDAPRLLPPTREAMPEPSPAQQGFRLLERLLWSTAHAAEPRSALVLRWEPIPGAQGYVLEIAEDRDFARPVLREQLSVPYFRWKVVARRDYFWRVRGVDAAGREGLHSEVLKIGSEIAPPALLSPAADARLELAGPEPVILRWEGNGALARYRVELAADPGFLAEVSVLETQEPWVRLPPGRWGAVWWRVTGLDLEGQGSGVSVSRRFSTHPAPPRPSGPSRVVVTDASGPALQLAWSARPVARYEVELARAEGPAQRVVTTADHAELELLSAGSFSWRVRGLEPETGWSPAQQVEVPLDSPALLSPAADARLVTGPPTVLRWSPVLLAEEYELFLEPEGGGIPRVERIPAGTSQLELPALPPGRYGWTVRAVAAGGALLSENAPTHGFSVLPGPPAPRPPVAAAPPKASPALAPARRSLSVVVLTGAGTAVGLAPSPWLGVEAQWRPAHPTLEWGLGLRASASEASQRLSPGSWQVDSRLVRVPVELTALLAFPAGPLTLDAAAGPVLRGVLGTVAFPDGAGGSQQGLELGATLRGGLEYRLGPGAVRAELAATASTSTLGLIRTPPAGLAAGLGYRWEAW